jgi:hypothetical protein
VSTEPRKERYLHTHTNAEHQGELKMTTKRQLNVALPDDARSQVELAQLLSPDERVEMARLLSPDEKAELVERIATDELYAGEMRILDPAERMPDAKIKELAVLCKHRNGGFMIFPNEVATIRKRLDEEMPTDVFEQQLVAVALNVMRGKDALTFYYRLGNPKTDELVRYQLERYRSLATALGATMIDTASRDGGGRTLKISGRD